MVEPSPQAAGAFYPALRHLYESGRKEFNAVDVLLAAGHATTGYRKEARAADIGPFLESVRSRGLISETIGQHHGQWMGILIASPVYYFADAYGVALRAALRRQRLLDQARWIGSRFVIPIIVTIVGALIAQAIWEGCCRR